MTMTARENLLQQIRQATREYTLAIEARRRVKKELRKAEDRVREARRKLRLVEQAIPDEPSAAKCAACGGLAGESVTCSECSAYRAFLR